MLEKSKKHANKILVFFLNFLLMAIAVLAIKQKDDSKKNAEAQGDLQSMNAVLSDENTELNNDLQGLGDVPNSQNSKILPDKNASAVNNSAPNFSPAAPAVGKQNTSSSGLTNKNIPNNSSNSSNAGSSGSISPNSNSISANSKTKTS